ncbi:MAG: flagellar biosynthetic protein FliR [Nocardioidaceae bacterium]
MTLSVGGPQLITLLLVSIRIVAWLVVVPPFSTKAVPSAAKVVLAVALAMTIAPNTSTPPPTETVTLVGEAVVQALVGASMGFVTYLIFAAIQAAGDLIDVFGGFSLASGYDPLSQNTNSVFGRLYQMLATMLLFVTGAHLIVIGGLLHTFDVLPIGASIDMGHLSHTVMTAADVFFTCAVQIALPLVGVLFVADLGLALMTKVAPQLNAIQLSFPAKIALTLMVVGLSFRVLPTAMERLTELITHATAAIAGG